MFEEAQRPIHTVPVGSLLPADSPRVEGLNEDHVKILADSGTEFEPILVHREEGRVVDGMHRLQATILRGEHDIAVRYVDGSSADLFIRSVQANVNHGLPLTLRDRKTAVVRILTTHPHWSDRAIATAAGVSPKTVGAARGRLSTEESPHSNPSVARLGKDGRVRPVDIRERREKALGLLAEQPKASLREVSEAAGVSISTAHRLRQELRSRPTAPTPGGQRPAPVNIRVREDSAWPSGLVISGSRREPGLTTVPHPDDSSSGEVARTRIKALDTLANDPSIRFTDSGRTLLRWLNSQARGLAAAEQLFAQVPPHCVGMLAEVVGHYARHWEQLAVEMQQSERGDESWREAR
ncbi:ParB N-terminal domain-containing protein [Streptacidiphilus sp. PB12-B1b]|uniref:helix-turn-helix domain-containing protein n=1 Tax=Streptacidiphilus sp. PB12-B1b TaxID=2705012 RepID=UPI0015FE67D9|nr:helix-turn-helix domain-containing protein [Streptacidiphilus sp. PB12-B1b]QMU74638.1 ParB N-terminal domain-containing protein [Streptacidiphilus sp. PB12-B1b]